MLMKGCPLVLGGPLPHVVAAKAVAFQEAASPDFVSYAKRIVDNARALAERKQGDEGVQPLMRFLRRFPTIPSVETFVDLLGSSIFEAHVSNASGLLGEGARYGEGDIDMERVIGRLARTARYLVTETLEPDNDRAVYMREAQTGMADVLRRVTSEGARTGRSRRSPARSRNSGHPPPQPSPPSGEGAGRSPADG